MAKLGTATVFITGNVKGLNDALGRAQYSARRTVGNITASMTKMGRNMSIAGAAMTAALGGMINNWAQAGDEVQKMAQRTGFSTEALSEFRHAAELSGTSLQAMEKGVRRMQRTITEAGEEGADAQEKHQNALEKLSEKIADAQRDYQELASSGKASNDQLAKAADKLKDAQMDLAEATEAGPAVTGTYAEALDMLGIKFSELEGKKPEEQFDRIVMALADVEDKTRQSAIAQEIFGRSGAELLPILSEGSEGLAGMREEARRLGIVFDQEAADKAAQLNDDILRLKKQFAATAFEVAETLVPILLEHVIPALQKLAKQVTRYIEENPKLIMAFAAVAGALSAGGPLLLGLSQLVTLIATLGWSVVPVAVALVGFAALLETFSNPTGFDNFLTRAIDDIETMEGKIGSLMRALKNLTGLEAFEQFFQFLGTVSGGGGGAGAEFLDYLKSLPGVGLIPGFNPETRATGGPVSSRTPYLVGERGPELFVPSTAGQIINNRETGRIMGGQNINIVVNARTNADPREIAKSVRREIRMSFANA